MAEPNSRSKIQSVTGVQIPLPRAATCPVFLCSWASVKDAVGMPSGDVSLPSASLLDCQTSLPTLAKHTPFHTHINHVFRWLANVTGFRGNVNLCCFLWRGFISRAHDLLAFSFPLDPSVHVHWRECKRRAELDVLIRARYVLVKPRCMCPPHVPRKALSYWHTYFFVCVCVCAQNTAWDQATWEARTCTAGEALRDCCRALLLKSLVMWMMHGVMALTSA